MTAKVSQLVKGTDIFTRVDLLKKAAAYKDLILYEGAKEAYSEPITVCVLDEKLLALLAERRIRRQLRPDTNYEIFTLIDENPQERVPGWNPSNCWNFKMLKDDKKNQYDLRIELSVGFRIDIKERGIVLSPQAHGSLVSPCDHLPNFRMFKALVESGGNPPLVAREIAASDDGYAVVSWTSLHLGGIRRVFDLFAEFSRGNEAINGIANRGDVFEPEPTPRHQEPGDELFIVEPAQPKVFKMWKRQLEEYRSKLTV